MAPRLIQSISSNVRNKKKALKRLWSVAVADGDRWQVTDFPPNVFFWIPFVLKLLSAHIERFSVSCMQDFKVLFVDIYTSRKKFAIGLTNILTYRSRSMGISTENYHKQLSNE